MKTEADLTNAAAHYKMMASVLRTAAALYDLAAAAAGATAGISQLSFALAPLEEWDDVLIEDALDADEIG